MNEHEFKIFKQPFTEDGTLVVIQTGSLENFDVKIYNIREVGDCHGNCRNWERWEYNKHIRTDLGICRACDVLKFCHANGKSCEEFDEL